MHYTATLHAWRERFRARLDEVRALGYDERFIRMWDIAYCEAAFAERYIGDFQLLMAKNRAPRPLFGDPSPRALDYNERHRIFSNSS
jgi:cyclopropane-fatty-acyl-phospholipid synthase